LSLQQLSQWRQMSVRRGERWIGCANQGLLERETERLKKAVAELALDQQIVEEQFEGNF
jgi:hypothetical protein